MPTIDELRKKLTDAVTACEAAGFRVADVIESRGDDCCCLLGAVGQAAGIRPHHVGGPRYQEAAIQVLGITESDARAIEHGFMGLPAREGMSPQLVALGAEFRERS